MKFNNHPEDQTKIPGNSLAQEVTTIFCHSGIKRFGSDIYPMYVHTKKSSWPLSIILQKWEKPGQQSCYVVPFVHAFEKFEDHKVLMESCENIAHSSCVHSLNCPHECANPVSVNQICFLLRTTIYLVTSYYFYSKVDYSCKNQWFEDTNML